MADILVSQPLGNITTSKILTIGTVATLVEIGSGNRAMEIFNAGPTDLYYGNSSVLVGSGNAIWVDGYHFWDKVKSLFSVYCIANSALTGVIVNEYE